MVADIDKFKEIKGFDERFFMYFEDNDLCLSLKSRLQVIVHTLLCSYPFYGKGAHRNAKLFRVF